MNTCYGIQVVRMNKWMAEARRKIRSDQRVRYSTRGNGNGNNNIRVQDCAYCLSFELETLETKTARTYLDRCTSMPLLSAHRKYTRRNYPPAAASSAGVGGPRLVPGPLRSRLHRSHVPHPTPIPLRQRQQRWLEWRGWIQQ